MIKKDEKKENLLVDIVSRNRGKNAVAVI